MNHQMVLARTAELSGQALNWAVAKATGGSPWITPFGAVGFDSSCWAMGAYEPHHDRSLAQGIFDSFLVSFVYEVSVSGPRAGTWSAWCLGASVFTDTNRLVAGLRAVVYSKFGDEIEVPSVLVK